MLTCMNDIAVGVEEETEDMVRRRVKDARVRASGGGEGVFEIRREGMK